MSLPLGPRKYRFRGRKLRLYCLSRDRIWWCDGYQCDQDFSKVGRKRQRLKAAELKWNTPHNKQKEPTGNKDLAYINKSKRFLSGVW